MSITFYAAFEESKNCWSYLPHVETVNVSNSNGYALIRELQFTAEDSGIAPVCIDTFMSRCTAALRNRMRTPDLGIPLTESRGAGGATFFDCGRPDGYLQDRVMELLALARDGKAGGATHVYAA